MNTLEVYLFVALILFGLGLFGLLQSRSFIGMLIGVELMLNGCGLNFMAFNKFVIADPAVGQIFVLFVMGIAAAETAIALSIILALFKKIQTINAEKADTLKG